MKILYLTLKKKWFDLILSGEKTEEYIEIKPYWQKRLTSKSYDIVVFRNGYAADAPQFSIELKSITQGVGKIEWGAEKDKMCFILKLGAIINKGED